MLLHAGPCSGVQRHPGGGNCGHAGHLDTELGLSNQCHGQCAGGSATGNAGGLRALWAGLPARCAVLLRVRCGDLNSDSQSLDQELFHNLLIERSRLKQRDQAIALKGHGFSRAAREQVKSRALPLREGLEETNPFTPLPAPGTSGTQSPASSRRRDDRERRHAAPAAARACAHRLRPRPRCLQGQPSSHDANRNK